LTRPVLRISLRRVRAGALARPDFSWDRDGERLLASTPGDDEPTVTLAIVPSLCSK